MALLSKALIYASYFALQRLSEMLKRCRVSKVVSGKILKTDASDSLFFTHFFCIQLTKLQRINSHKGRKWTRSHFTVWPLKRTVSKHCFCSLPKCLVLMLAWSQRMQVIFKQANFAGIKLVQVSSCKELADCKKVAKYLRPKELKPFPITV